MLRSALFLAALASLVEARRAWRRDRDLNGRQEASPTRWLDLLAGVGAPVVRAGLRLPAPPWVVPGSAAGGYGAELAGARAGGAVLFGTVGLAAVLVTGSLLGLIAGLGCTAFGWMFPDLWLRAAARARAAAIEREAPLALDLIASAVAAGISIDEAMALAAEVATGPLRLELESALANLSLGHRRNAELTDLAGRTESPSLRRLAAALRTSDRLGVPLAAGLRRQAARARAEESRRTQERAARAAPRILLVVVFVLVPAAMLPVMTALGLVAARSVGPVVGAGL